MSGKGKGQTIATGKKRFCFFKRWLLNLKRQIFFFPGNVEIESPAIITELPDQKNNVDSSK